MRKTMRLAFVCRVPRSERPRPRVGQGVVESCVASKSLRIQPCTVTVKRSLHKGKKTDMPVTPPEATAPTGAPLLQATRWAVPCPSGTLATPHCALQQSPARLLACELRAIYVFSRHQACAQPPIHQEPQLEHKIQARPTLAHLTRTLPHTALSENKAAPTLEEEGKGEGRGGEGEELSIVLVHRGPGRFPWVQDMEKCPRRVNAVLPCRRVPNEAIDSNANVQATSRARGLANDL